jgi:hypothetical protein
VSRRAGCTTAWKKKKKKQRSMEEDRRSGDVSVGGEKQNRAQLSSSMAGDAPAVSECVVALVHAEAGGGESAGGGRQLTTEPNRRG